LLTIDAHAKFDAVNRVPALIIGLLLLELSAACSPGGSPSASAPSALERFDPNTGTDELEQMLDDLTETLMFVEDTNMDTARINGAALTAITGLSLAIINGEDISGLVAPAAQALRALQVRVCG
jgi:hypothetical protein